MKKFTIVARLEIEAVDIEAAYRAAAVLVGDESKYKPNAQEDPHDVDSYRYKDSKVITVQEVK